MLNEPVNNLLKEAISALIEIDPDIEEAILNSIETPPSLEFGERSSNIAFKLAKPLQKSPVVIAEDVSDNINKIISNDDGISRTEATKGYINFFYDFSNIRND